MLTNFQLFSLFHPKILLLLNLALTGYMTGLIWFVQIVHYPLFKEVAKLGPFAQYSRIHSALTTVVVGPVMVAELAVAVALTLSAASKLNFILLGLVLGIWAVTFFLSVPNHTLLADGFDETAWLNLVQTNWLRTLAWTVRLGLLIYLSWPD